LLDYDGLSLVGCRINRIGCFRLNEFDLLSNMLNLVVQLAILRDKAYSVFAVLVGVLGYLHLIILLQSLLSPESPILVTSRFQRAD